MKKYNVTEYSVTDCLVLLRVAKHITTILLREVLNLVFEMNLEPSPFENIAAGRKTLELRLFDDKRRIIDIGDIIIFTNTAVAEQKIAVIVKSLHRYATFEEMFMDIPIELWGDEIIDTPNKAVAKMSEYYTDAKIHLYGVLGIGVALVDIKTALKQLEAQKDAEYEKMFPDGMK